MNLESGCFHSGTEGLVHDWSYYCCCSIAVVVVVVRKAPLSIRMF